MIAESNLAETFCLVLKINLQFLAQAHLFMIEQEVQHFENSKKMTHSTLEITLL